MEYKIGSEARYAVIGHGSWATALVRQLTQGGERVGWYVRNGEVLESLRSEGRNSRYLSDTEFDRSRIAPSGDLDAVVRGAEVIILDEVKVYGKCTNVAGYIGKMDDLDNEYRHMAGSYYYWTKDYNEEIAELFNEYFTFELSYIPDNTRVASLFVQKYFDEAVEILALLLVSKIQKR